MTKETQRATQMTTCPSCAGTGEDGAFHPCLDCHGDGLVRSEPPEGAGDDLSAGQDQRNVDVVPNRSLRRSIA